MLNFSIPEELLNENKIKRDFDQELKSRRIGFLHLYHFGITNPWSNMSIKVAWSYKGIIFLEFCE